MDCQRPVKNKKTNKWEVFDLRALEFFIGVNDCCGNDTSELQKQFINLKRKRKLERLLK